MSFRLVWSVALMTTVLSVPSAFGQETGTLKAKFVYGGSAFDPAAIDVNKDKEFCGKHPLVERAFAGQQRRQRHQERRIPCIHWSWRLQGACSEGDCEDRNACQ
jgi:hypothetical protein